MTNITQSGVDFATKVLLSVGVVVALVGSIVLYLDTKTKQQMKEKVLKRK